MQVDPLANAEPVREALAPEPEPQRLYLHMPIDVRSVSLAVIALMLSRGRVQPRVDAAAGTLRGDLATKLIGILRVDWS